MSFFDIRPYARVPNLYIGSPLLMSSDIIIKDNQPLITTDTDREGEYNTSDMATTKVLELS